MSHEEDKFKHSKRLLKDNNAIKKQVKIALKNGLKVKNIVPGKFAKKHAMDCGKPNCSLCGNPRRSGWGEKLTQQEKRLFQAMDVRNNKHSNGKNVDVDEE